MQGGAGTPLGLIGVGFQVASSLASGKARSDSYSFQADQLTKNARAARVQADQTDSHLRDELESTVANIRAIRASAGMPDSATSDAIINKEGEVSDNQRRIKVGSLRAQADEYDNSAAFMRRQARNALNFSYLSAAGVGFKGLSAR
jgi:hypothetical protein